MGACCSLPDETGTSEKSRLLRDGQPHTTQPRITALLADPSIAGAYGAHESLEKSKLSEILNRTARDVIDVRSSFEPVVGQDLLDRQTQYSNVIQATHAPSAAVETVQVAPGCVVQMLERRPVQALQKDAEMAKAVCLDVTKALADVAPARTDVIGLFQSL